MQRCYASKKQAKEENRADSLNHVSRGIDSRQGRRAVKAPRARGINERRSPIIKGNFPCARASRTSFPYTRILTHIHELTHSRQSLAREKPTSDRRPSNNKQTISESVA